MQTHAIGASSLTCSRLAYGCWRLAGGEGKPRIESADASRAVHAAFDAGFSLFDNADIYGRGECERIFGMAMREVPLDLSGNALGPFAPGQVVTVLTEVSNSVGTRTSAPRTILIAEPIV